MKKIYIFLFLLVFTNCTSVVEDYVYGGKTNCPNLSSPKGSEELVVKTENNIVAYVGFRGIKTKCLLNRSLIKIDLEVNIRTIRNQIEFDDSLPINLSLVSTDINKNVFERDDLNLNIFLKKGSKIIDRSTKMSVNVPMNGEVLLGLNQ